MSLCKYCGQKAGWFSDSHDECKQRAQLAAVQIRQIAKAAVIEVKPYDDVSGEIEHIATSCHVPRQGVVTAVREGWSEGAVEKCKAEPFPMDKYSIVTSIYKGVGLTADDVKKTPGFYASAFSMLIWSVLNDEIDPYQGPVTFNLHAGEIPVFGMANVLVSEQKTASSYVGGYSGVSVRIASGLYYRLGAMQGHKMQSTSLQEVDYGDFLMTTKAIYFGGTEKGVNFRLPYKQIVRFQPYSDAVGICKDGAKEKVFAPQHVPDSGWFLFNILQALATKDTGASAHA